MPGKVRHAWDGGQLQKIEYPDRQHVPAAPDLVAAVCGYAPTGRVLPPLGSNHAGVEEGIVHQVELLGDRFEMAEDLLSEGVAPSRDVVELLEHGKVRVRLDVAHHARVAVPIPSAPDAARLVDDPDPLDACLAQAGAGQDPRDPSSHDHDIDFVGEPLALLSRGERVPAVPCEIFVGP